MKILIDDTIYEGSAAEILDRLRLRFDDGDAFPDRESYIRQLCINIMRSTGQECSLPERGEEERSRALLFRLADVGALEVLPDDETECEEPDTEYTGEIAVLLVEPGKPPTVRRILPTVEAFREVVGGPLQETCPFSEPIVIVFNADGEALRLPQNCLLRNGAGEPYAVIHGPFLAAGVSDGFCASLTDEQIQRLRAAFSRDRLFSAE